MYIKAPLSSIYLQNKNVSPIIEVYFELNHLKQLYRQGWLRYGVSTEHCESVADHLFSVAMLALFLTDHYFPSLDQSKVIRMALLHDLCEIYAGDMTPADMVDSEQKRQIEEQSLTKVLSKLPNGDEYIKLWEEFETGDSPEAKFVRQIDRLEMGLQASVYNQQGCLDPTIFFSSANQILTEPKLIAILKEIESLKVPS